MLGSVVTGAGGGLGTWKPTGRVQAVRILPGQYLDTGSGISYFQAHILPGLIARIACLGDRAAQHKHKVEARHATTTPLHIGIIGDYNAAFHSYQATDAAIQHAADYLDQPTVIEWLLTIRLAHEPDRQPTNFDAL